MMPPSNTKGAGIEDLQIEAAEVARTEAFLESGAVQVQPRAQKDEGPTGSKGGEDGGVKIASEKKRGWASLDDGSGLAAAKQMVVDGTGARDKDSLERSPRQSTRIARSEKGSKRLRREAAADAGVSSTANQFAALADHGEGKGRVPSFESKGPDTVLNRAAKEHSHLMSADSVGVARRDLKPRTEGGEAAGRGSVGKELKELKVLRPLMSLNEWQKLSSAKQRKKIRKLAARDAKQETLRTKLMNEANEEDFKMESALKVDVGSGRLAAVPTDQRFHVETAGRGMQISQGGLVVRRGPGVSTPTYVFWGSQLSEGISRWALRIDRKRSSVYIGVADMPLDPDEGFAKYLQSSAWMLSDCGALFETQQGTARNSLRERLIPSPDGGHTVEVNIPSIGTAIYTAKNKYRKHRYAFKDGSLVKVSWCVVALIRWSGLSFVSMFCKADASGPETDGVGPGCAYTTLLRRQQAVDQPDGRLKICAPVPQLLYRRRWGYSAAGRRRTINTRGSRVKVAVRGVGAYFVRMNGPVFFITNLRGRIRS